MVPVALSAGTKRPRHEADYSPPFSTGVTSARIYTALPRKIFKAWYLIKHRYYLTFFQ